MIKLDRLAVEKPSSLETDRVRVARDAAAKHFRASDARARQSQHRFEPLYKAQDVRESLRELFSNKCAFCESPLGGVSPGDVHHFRPRQGAVDPRSGETSRRHYWWLAYEWENLYLACARCNRSAGSRFPVEGKRARGGATGVELRREKPLLLDPCNDYPDDSLLFQLDGSLAPGDRRGEQTIETFALNRPSLVSARLARVQMVQQGLERGTRDLSDAIDDAAPYAGMIRQLRGALSGVDLSLRADLNFHVELSADPQISSAVRIVRAEIENFRAIESLALDFQSEPDSWTMLLGENGDGKSSVLQALAIALMNGSQRSRIDAEAYLRHGARRGRISVELSDRSVREVDFAADESRFRAAPARQLVLAGYGAYRAPGRGAPRRTPAPRVNSILSPYVRLISPTEWLLQVDRRTFDAAAAAISRLLLDEEGYLQRRRGRVLYRRPDGGPIGLDELSAGYRSTIALAVDLMSYMLVRWGDVNAAEGIVLIDELGTHLHPRWQMKVVEAFREAFPRVQFVATTHDPLCLRGLRDGEVIVLRRDTERRVVAIDDLPSIAGLYVDQLLTSEYFGLGSTLDPEIEVLLEEYYALIAEPRPDARRPERVAVLRKQLEAYRQLGRTERERLALEAVDEVLAQRRRDPRRVRRGRPTAAVSERIAQLWAEAGL